MSKTPAEPRTGEREAFEKWYCADATRQGFGCESISDLRDGDNYGEHRTMLNGKWEGWQASARDQQRTACNFCLDQARAALAAQAPSPVPDTDVRYASQDVLPAPPSEHDHLAEEPDEIDYDIVDRIVQAATDLRCDLSDGSVTLSSDELRKIVENALAEAPSPVAPSEPSTTQIHKLAQAFGLDLHPQTTEFARAILRVTIPVQPRQAERSLTERSEWISVAERLPRADDLVIFAMRGRVLCVGYKSIDDADSMRWLDELDCDRDGDPKDCYEVTHWRPMPLPPLASSPSGKPGGAGE